MITRRSFIRNSSILSAGLMLDPHLALDAPVKNIGLQLYTVRNIIGGNIAPVLARIATIGFKEIETFGYSPETKFWGVEPKAFKALLEENRLESPSSHFGFDEFFDRSKTEQANSMFEAARAIGNKYVTVAILEEKNRRNADDYKRIASKLNALGEIAKQHDLQLAYHNHDFEFAKIDLNARGYDIIMNSTDKDLVKLQLDLFWTTKAGQDPVSLFEKDPGRFVMWHVKDMSSESRSFTEVGTGIIDFKRIFSKASVAGVKHIFVEQDEVTKDVYSSIKESYDYVKKNLI
jgi:sugar phosphate isomerase/epimerase